MMTETKQIRVTTEGEVGTVVGIGELDLSKSKEFSLALQSLLMSEAQVVVDLRDALFIDTAILAVLARVGKTMLDQKRILKILVVPNSHPQYVLKTVGFDQLMDITVDEEHAVAEPTGIDDC